MQSILRVLHLVDENLYLFVAADFHERETRLHALKGVASIVRQSSHCRIDRCKVFCSQHTLVCEIRVGHS
jgi:tyrosine-protein phosphatase YwqE